MARRVDEVELVVPAVARAVRHADGVELDRDPALALEVQRIQDLLFHLALLERARRLDQAVRQRRFAVVDVRDDAEIPDPGALHRPEYTVWRAAPAAP